MPETPAQRYHREIEEAMVNMRTIARATTPPRQPRCQGCGEFTSRESLLPVHDTRDVATNRILNCCPSCQQAHARTCSTCGRLCFTNAMHYINPNPSGPPPRITAETPRVCSECATAANLARCSQCGYLGTPAQQVRFGIASSCRACLDNMLCCCLCHTLIQAGREHLDADAPPDQRGPFCESCYIGNGELLESTYTRNPSHRRAGIELEFVITGAIVTPGTGRIKGDGSVGPHNGRNETPNEGEFGVGREFASLTARGDALLDLITRACDRLNAREAYVNKTCGYHLHIDVADLGDGARDNIAFWWQACEPFFFSLVSASRRNNRYCASVRTQRTMREWMNTRYWAFNTSAWHKHQTFEIRLHQGTLSASKVANWALLHLAFFEHFATIDIPRFSNGNVDTITASAQAGGTPTAIWRWLTKQIKFKPALCNYVLERMRTFAHIDTEQADLYEEGYAMKVLKGRAPEPLDEPDEEPDDVDECDNEEPCNCYQCRCGRGEEP